jgi:hypothetical protein
MFTKDELEKALENAWNLTEVARALGYEKEVNTLCKRKIKKALEDAGLSIAHLRTTQRPRFKHERVFKLCPVCNKEFQTQKDHPKEKTVCSKSCSNTHFRSGSQNPNYKESGTNYREVALRSKKNICERCGWAKYVKVLEVHHVDRNRSNNALENLLILCPTCHRVEHYLLKKKQQS